MIPPTFYSRNSGRDGFTLLEMLVAVAILGTLILFLGQVVALTSHALALNNMKLDSAAQARFFFDRLSMDLAARPRRSDLGAAFTKNGSADSVPGTNDSLQFYSAVDAYSGTRSISWISYQISTTSPSTNQLVRGANGTSWSGTTVSPVYWLTGTPAAFTQTPTASSGNNVVLASGIFRLEFAFLLNTGVMTNGATTVTAPTYSNVEGLVVGVAVLDSRNLALLNSSQLGTLAGDFQDTAEGDSPVTDWSNQMAQTGFGAGFPPQAIQNVRLYKRTFIFQ